MAVRVPTRVLERRLRGDGHAIIAGMDEVGRGPLAGPLTVGAVVLPERCRLNGVRDSKYVPVEQRQKFARIIRRQAVAVGIGWASCTEIDELGLTRALQLAGERALATIGLQIDAIILDGNHNYLAGSWNVTTAIKADETCLPVAAASIVAKVARDSYMELLDRSHPGYGFAQHKGYGVASHLAALKQYGVSVHHRQRWKSVGLAA